MVRTFKILPELFITPVAVIIALGRYSANSPFQVENVLGAMIISSVFSLLLIFLLFKGESLLEEKLLLALRIFYWASLALLTIGVLANAYILLGIGLISYAFLSALCALAAGIMLTKKTLKKALLAAIALSSFSVACGISYEIYSKGLYALNSDSKLYDERYPSDLTASITGIDISYKPLKGPSKVDIHAEGTRGGNCNNQFFSPNWTTYTSQEDDYTIKVNLENMPIPNSRPFSIANTYCTGWGESFSKDQHTISIPIGPGFQNLITTTKVKVLSNDKLILEKNINSTAKNLLISCKPNTNDDSFSCRESMP